MANQHTKKKLTAPKKSAPKVKNFILQPIDVGAAMREAFGLKTPLMNKCDEKAKTQPHFTLLPADNFTPLLVKAWIDFAVRHNVSADKILEARQILKQIEQWRTDHPTSCHTPD